ncbi:MAG TPA: hypothetical protein VED40_02395 [Azospirillaceae bacterium]|nr:hypothetical protein [Azospirillaceae bacterium]
MRDGSEILAGMAGGVAATAPMTAAMVAMHRELPADLRYPLPPLPLTRQVMRAAGLPWPRDPETGRLLTMLAHFGYGGLVGAAWPAWARAMGRDPLSGVAFGLAVWAGSYLGWIPAVGLLEPATRHPTRRVGLMLSAHVVWGAATALAAEGVRRGLAPARPPGRTD